MRIGRMGLVCAVAAVLALSAGAMAQQIIFVGGGTQRNDGGIVAGSALGTASSQNINALGFIDVGDDGINGSYQVGLWDSGGSLIASATLTPSDPLINGFRWTQISPVVLPSGSFVVGALLPNSPPDPWLHNATLNLGPGYFGSGEGRFISSAVLTYPTTADTGNNYIVANAGNLVVPEPASMGLFGVAALALRRRRQA